jgi:NDP-sugar pyrophosphorylase family protein
MAVRPEIQIVIPMSGSGDRFRRAGYEVPKPLIPVEGRPIIAHVLDLFPGATDVLFICNSEQLASPGLRLRETLEALCPKGRIAAIQPHRLGPVHAVSRCYEALDPARPVLVNYCDFGCTWDWEHFQAFVARTACDGCIPCYRGFHPHMLRSTSFAYVRDEGGWAREIQEKAPFTSRPMEEWASSGAYYFSSGALLREAFDEALARRLTVQGEYYVSLAYRPLLERGLGIAVYELQHFLQWGTPEDLAEYLYFSDTFRLLGRPRPERTAQRGAVLVPMAGSGARFEQAGFSRPKPLIPVSGRPMALQATADLPRPERYHFVLRRDLGSPGDLAELRAGLGSLGPAVGFTELAGPTDGQARSCLAGLGELDPDAPLTIGACDNGAIYDPAALEALLGDPGVDVLVWTVRGFPGAARRPQEYGWVIEAEGRITGVSVKKPLGSPSTDPVILGTFTFRRARDFAAAAARLLARNARVNGELYVDSAIEDALSLGLACVSFPVERYLCWGTPEELRTFEYYQSCFHKWHAHPYRLEADPRVDPQSLEELELRYALTRPDPEELLP